MAASGVRRAVRAAWDALARRRPVAPAGRPASRGAFEAALRAARTVAWEWDLATDRVTYSDGAEELLGRTSGFPHERTWELMHPDDVAGVRCATERLLERGGTLVLEYRTRTPQSSEYIWIEVSGRLERDDGGKPRRVVGLSRDVTQRHQLEEQLRTSEERLARALRASRNVVLDWDLATGVVRRSSNVAEVYGTWLPLEGTLEEGLALVHPDDVARTRAALEALRETGEPLAAEFRFVKPDGSVLWMEFRGGGVRSPEGKLVRVAAVLSDVTARKELEEGLRRSEGRLRSLLQNTPLGVVEWDASFRVRGWSGAAERIFGWSAADIVGKTIEETHLVYDEDWPQLRAVMGRMRDPSNPYVISQNRNWTMRGEVIHTVWYNSLFFDEKGVLESALSLVLDVTEQVEANAERAQLLDALRERAEALADADRRKDEFLALLAHELRNPLAPIRNGVHVLERSEDAGERAGTLAVIDRQVAHMVRLVDDLLDVGRITRGKLRIERAPVEMGAIAAGVVEAHRGVAEARGVALDFSGCGEPMRLRGDAARLAQVTSNLLDNALKFTPAGGRVALSLAREGSEAVVAVSDTGIGIPPERVDEIFGMFVQEDASLERAQGGLGLGLTLVRSLVELHGGTVRGESPGRGRGSVFTVRLPLDDGAPAGEEAPAAAIAPEAVRVLVVDDSADAAESLASFLRLLGHEVETACDGRRALEAAERSRPDLVLCDVGMPGMSGLDVARGIRRLFEGRGPTLVALTGYGGEKDRRSTREAGFDAHIVKPVDVPALEALLARVAETRSGRGEGRVEP